MSVNVWDVACSWVNKRTADACYDYREQEVVNYPRSRAITRLIITICVLNVALLAFFIFAFVSNPDSRTTRHWGSKFILKANTSHFGSSHLFCPCNKSASKWPLYVSFHWVLPSSSPQTLNRSAIATNPSLLCDALHHPSSTYTSGIWLKGCYEMAVSFMHDAPITTVETPSLLGPSSVARLIIPAMQNNINNVVSDYGYLLTSNMSEDWMMLMKIKHLFNRVGEVFLNSSSGMVVGDANMTDFLYWEAFNKDMVLQMPSGNVKAMELTGNKALAMAMNWTAYMLLCGPVYCDAVMHNTWIRKLLWSVSEVGGFSAFILVFLRCLVWPVLKRLCKWDLYSSHPHFHNHERNIEQVGLYPPGQPLSV